MKNFLKLFLTISICVFSLTYTYAGPKIEFGDDGFVKVLLLGQVHYSFMDGAADEEDFFLRRGRLIFVGQIKDGVKVFVETDNDKLGKSGVSSSMDIQDAFIEARLGDSTHYIQGGLVLLPFSFESTSSAASLLGIDYNAEVIKLTSTFVWRDFGAMLRGNIGDKFAYRLSVTEGYDNALKNTEADYRTTGHIAVNLVGEVEKGWFASQDRLGAKGNYLSIGAGFDSQGNATEVAVSETAVMVQDSDAYVVDFQSGMVMDEFDITLNGAYHDWESAIFEGKTYFLEAGFRYNMASLSLKYSLQDRDMYDEVADTTIGLHYFMDKKHNAKIGIETRTGDSADWTLLGVSFLL